MNTAFLIRNACLYEAFERNVMLEPNWLIDKHIDFEYKKYRVLAYLQRVDQSLTEHRVFPVFPDLLLHRDTLSEVRERKQSLWNRFRKRVKGLNSEQKRWEYEPTVSQSTEMDEIDSIIDFSLPKFAHYIDEASELIELAEQQISVYPIGITPLHLREGYLIVPIENAREACVYQYSVGMVTDLRTEFTHVRTTFVSSFSASVSSTYEHIKRKLVQQRPDMPNPATYAVDCGIHLPMNETLVPVAAQVLARTINTAA